MNTPESNTPESGRSAAPGQQAENRKPEHAPPDRVAGQPAWRRPAPMSKDSNTRAWLIFFAVVCLGAALWAPLRAFYYQHRYQPIADARPRDAACFVAVVYPGVSEDPPAGSQDITPAAFEAQIKILRDRGYTPIELKDVLAFYDEGKPLPRKAILTTFSQTRKTSYFEVRQLLRVHRWKAVMGICTSPIHARDPQALLWPYLRDMLNSGSWELAGESQNGYPFVPAFSDGSTGPFFSTPKWLAEANRHEYPEEFRARIRGDHEAFLAEFARETQQKPLAFFFPYGDYGQFDERAQFVRLSNLYQVGEKYPLGFALGNLALNTRLTDRRRLNRLLVDPQWTAEELANRLDAFWPMEMALDTRMHVFSRESVIREWGGLKLLDQGFSLYAIPPENPVYDERLDERKRTATSGSRVWLAGSDTFMDGHFVVRFHLAHGRFGVYLRAVPGHEYLYFLVDENGQVGVRQKLPDLDEVTLAAEDAPIQQASNHELVITLKGNLLYARLDDKTLFDGPVLLREKPRPGMLGMSVWERIPGVAAANVLDARILARQEAIANWTPHTARDVGYLTHWLSEHSFRFSILSPPWIDIFEGSPQKFPIWDQEAIDLLARTNQARIYPHIQIRQSSGLMPASADVILDDLVMLTGVSGLFIDATAVRTEEVNALVNWLLRLQEGMGKAGFRLAIKLPQVIESLPSANNMLKLFPNALLVGDFKQPPFGLTADRVVSIDSVSPPSGDKTLALYYQISNLTTNFEGASAEVMHEALRQKGHDAFAAGDYEGAIAIWSQWFKADPRSAEAVGLIGDAQMRMNALNLALQSYTRSLELNPGEMNLAVRRARLLETMKRMDESVAALNMYSRTFPDSPPIIVAQAHWMSRNGQRDQARALMRDLVNRYPHEIESRLVLQTLLDQPTERYANIRALLDMCEGQETQHFALGKELGAIEWLAIPEASVFFDFIRRTAAHSPNKQTRELYQSFLPRTNSVVEDFSTGKLSDNWFYLGGLRPLDRGRYELKASTDMAEAFLRLKKSELLRDGFLEVRLDESAGYFWIYARRSARAMVRFGFDNEGFIHIQSWLNGDITSYEKRPWMRPPGMVTLRLEVRGDGAMGYINDLPAFSTPLIIPSEVAYGWWSIAPFSPDYGVARARISSMRCGPLAPVLVMLPPLNDARMNDALDWIRPRVRNISALCPVTFLQNPDGTIGSVPQTAFSLTRMFANYHRLRLMPVLDMTYYSDIEPARIIDLIQEHELAGLIVRIRILPDEAWFKKLEREMERTTADLIVIRNERTFWPIPGTAEAGLPMDGERKRLKLLPTSLVREIPRGSLLLPPIAATWTIRVQPYQDWMTETNHIDVVGTELRLFVVPNSIIGTNTAQVVAAANKALQEEALTDALQTVREEDIKNDTTPTIPQRIELPSAVPAIPAIPVIPAMPSIPAVPAVPDAAVKAGPQVNDAAVKPIGDAIKSTAARTAVPAAPDAGQKPGKP